MVQIVVASVLLVMSIGVCVAGIPDVLFGRLVAAWPCGDADLDPAHPACTLADPDRAELGFLLVLTLPVLATVTALVGAVGLSLLRRRWLAIAILALALALSFASLLEGRAILDTELPRIVHLS